MSIEKTKVLCVDDEPDVLQGLKLHLRKNYNVFIATSGHEGLDILSTIDSIKIVLSDMRMPNMDGAEFLKEVHLRYPNKIRMLLTGHSDIDSAISAINEGQIFRFLTKPCPPKYLLAAFQAAENQYRLVHAEKELLQKTLKGSIKLLTDILSITDPDSSSRLISLSKMAAHIASTLELSNTWEIELAVLLSQIGSITVPSEIRKKRKNELSSTELNIVSNIPIVGNNLLANIPRLENVANYIKYQNKNYDGTGFPLEEISGEEIPLASRIMKILFDFGEYLDQLQNSKEAYWELKKRKKLYDPKLLELIEEYVIVSFDNMEILEISASKLRIGDRLASNIFTLDGKLLLCSGHIVSDAILERLKQHGALMDIIEPFKIERPKEK